MWSIQRNIAEECVHSLAVNDVVVNKGLLELLELEK